MISAWMGYADGAASHLGKWAIDSMLLVIRKVGDQPEAVASSRLQACWEIFGRPTIERKGKLLIRRFERLLSLSPPLEGAIPICPTKLPFALLEMKNFAKATIDSQQAERPALKN